MQTEYPNLASLDRFNPGRLRVLTDQAIAWMKDEREQLLLLAFEQGIHPGTCEIVSVAREDMGRHWIEMKLDLSNARPMTPDEYKEIYDRLQALGAARSAVLNEQFASEQGR